MFLQRARDPCFLGEFRWSRLYLLGFRGAHLEIIIIIYPVLRDDQHEAMLVATVLSLAETHIHKRFIRSNIGRFYQCIAIERTLHENRNNTHTNKWSDGLWRIGAERLWGYCLLDWTILGLRYHLSRIIRLTMTCMRRLMNMHLK